MARHWLSAYVCATAAAAGMRVALLDIVAEKLEPAAASCGELALAVVCDVTDPQSCNAALAVVRFSIKLRTH